MTVLVPLGLVCGLFAIVLWIASAVLSAPSQELTRTSDDPRTRVQLAVLAVRIALPLYLVGVVLTFVGSQRLPVQWFDYLAVMTMVPAAISVLRSTKRAHGWVLLSLAGLSALTGLGIFFVPYADPTEDILNFWYVLHMASATIGAGLIFCAASVAVRRLMTTRFGARTLILVSFGLGIVALFSGWVGPGDSGPFLVFSEDSGHVVVADLVVAERDTGDRLEKHITVRADHPLFSSVRDGSKIVLVASFVLILMSWLVPTVFYRAWAMIAAGIGAISLVCVLLVMVLLGVFGAEVSVDTHAYRMWIEHVQLVGLEPAIVLHSLVLPPGPYKLSLLSAPESFILLAFVVVAAIFSALRLQTGWLTKRSISEVRDAHESTAQVVFESDLVRYALPFWTAALASEAIWGQHRLGRLYHGDPVVLLGLSIWLGLGIYFAVQALLPSHKNAPSLVVVGLGILLGWLLLGPSLGWTVLSHRN
ncbi:MAG: hypothetical protein HUU55_13445 [Myxococcales bacterium]|nr:hypothetical protein [Myxococcales bacterium]